MTITRKGVLKEGHPCYHVTEGKPYMFTQRRPGHWFMINDKGVEQILREECIDFSCGAGREVLVYTYIILEEDVGDIQAGTHREVESININGSYMVKGPTGNQIPVTPLKARAVPHLGMKRVPCRHPTFSQGLEPQAPPMPPQAPVAPVQVQSCNPGEPMMPSAFDRPSTLKGPKIPSPITPVILDSDTRALIKKQKAVAQEILTFCMIMDHKAFIAGGAPRNWALNMAAKDIDVFLRVPNGAPESHLINVLEAFGVTGLFNLTTHTAPDVKRGKLDHQTIRKEDANKKGQRIRYVLEGIYQGTMVQFIILESDSRTGLRYAEHHFDTSINMIISTITPHGDLGTEQSLRFNDTMQSGVIFVQQNGSAYGNGDHLERIHSYFPEAPMVNECYRRRIMADLTKVPQYVQPWEELAGIVSIEDF